MPLKLGSYHMEAWAFFPNAELIALPWWKAVPEVSEKV
jgi:hypothetical protein